MDAGARQKEKQALFTELYELDNIDNGEEETSPMTAFTHRINAGKRINSTKIFESHFARKLGRTVSTPVNAVSTPSSASLSIIEDTPISSQRHASQPSIEVASPRLGPISKSFPAPENAMKMAKTGAKRKRGQSLEVIPESQKIFNGLSFYFIRPDDKDPFRRAKIRKAEERGALWVKEWRDTVTHVIADKDLNYKAIIDFLKIQSIPPNVALVNGRYTSDCMDCHAVLNPQQPQYYVDGYKEAQAVHELVTVSSSDASLSLKPDKSAFAGGPQTESRTESEQESLRQALEESKARAEEEQRQIVKIARSSENRDALDDAIAEAMIVKDLPLDKEEDEGSENVETLDHEDGSQSEDERKPRNPKWKKGSGDKAWEEKFNCMQKHDGLDQIQNPNCRTIEVLQQMADYHERDNDRWRPTAYRRAIAALRKSNVKIMTRDQAIAIPFIGERLADKIEEIVCTNRLRRLENANLEPHDEALQLFLNIYGVGPSQASAWVDQGFRTLNDIREKATLTKNQQAGVTYYSDFLKRIPRHEVELHGKTVRDEIAKVDSEIQVTIGGSYRRGAASSGDIDFIITKPDTPLSTLRTIMMATVIPWLHIQKYLRVTLADTSASDGSKWHGAACLPGGAHPKIMRRVDFLYVPWDEMGAALIYFTGNDIFNRSVRLLASKKGYRLNQHGLWEDVMRGPGRVRVTQGKLVEARSERRIFEILKVPFRAPEHRNC